MTIIPFLPGGGPDDEGAHDALTGPPHTEDPIERELRRLAQAYRARERRVATRAYIALVLSVGLALLEVARQLLEVLP